MLFHLGAWRKVFLFFSSLNDFVKLDGQMTFPLKAGAGEGWLPPSPSSGLCVVSGGGDSASVAALFRGCILDVTWFTVTYLF